jgi:hypothetical protein
MKREGKIVETGTEQCRKRMEIIEAGARRREIVEAMEVHREKGREIGETRTEYRDGEKENSGRGWRRGNERSGLECGE